MLWNKQMNKKWRFYSLLRSCGIPASVVFVALGLGGVWISGCSSQPTSSSKFSGGQAVSSSGGVARDGQGRKIDAISDLGPTVILVSIDGFRPSYLNQADSPFLLKLKKSGTFAAPSMKSVFPSLTFPSHYSMATGLSPGAHLIIANTMRDTGAELKGRTFKLSDRSEVTEPKWWGGEPFWITVQRFGLKSATMFWPGSEAEILGMRPNYWKEYDKKMPAEDRVAQVLDWVSLPKRERPNFITLYFEEVDSAGHEYGPMSEVVKNAVSHIDRVIAGLWSGLEARGVAHRVHLVVVSDHGMAPLDPEKTIYLEDAIDLSTVDLTPNGTFIGVYPKTKSELRGISKKIAKLHSGLKVYSKDQLPKAWKLGKSSRLPPLWVQAPEGRIISTSREEQKKRGHSLGGHGYDPNLPSMGALMISVGPRVKPGFEVRNMSVVDVHTLVLELLGTPGLSTEGSRDTIKKFVVMR